MIDARMYEVVGKWKRKKKSSSSLSLDEETGAGEEQVRDN